MGKSRIEHLLSCPTITTRDGFAMTRDGNLHFTCDKFGWDPQPEFPMDCSSEYRHAASMPFMFMVWSGGVAVMYTFINSRQGSIVVFHSDRNGPVYLTK